MAGFPRVAERPVVRRRVRRAWPSRLPLAATACGRRIGIGLRFAAAGPAAPAGPVAVRTGHLGELPGRAGELRARVPDRPGQPGPGAGASGSGWGPPAVGPGPGPPL